MAERILPTPDAFATCPTEGKLLEYYAGTFEAVYILLHPFIKSVKTTSIGNEQFNPTIYPDRSTIVENCAPVSWPEVASKTGPFSVTPIYARPLTLILAF